MGARCSICSNPELAETINKMLYQKVQQADIALQTGVTKSTVGRHANSCYLTYRALRNKSKTVSTYGRMIVSWPTTGERVLTYFGDVLQPNEVRDDDLIIVVNYQKIRVADVGNPRAVPLNESTFESFLEAAIAEDAERANSPSS